jgi:hypothetical protein
MVVAMVRFSAAIVDGSESMVRWGLAYAIAWAALLRVMSSLTPLSTSSPWLVLLILGAWGTFHAFWVWLALTARPQRASSRTAAGQFALAGVVFLTIVGLQFFVPHAADPPVKPGPLPLMILLTIIGVGLLIAGGVRTAKRNPPQATHDDDDGDEDESLATAPAAPQRTSAMMLVGIGLVIVGGFGAGMAAGPGPVQLMCGAALIFIAIQVVRGIRRR